MYRHVTTRLAGLIIVIAGIWGGLIPFLGPLFHFTLGPDHAWRWTTGRLWLSVLPAIAAVLGGLILMGRGPNLSGRFGALLALAGGVWFAVGPDVSMLWNHGVSQAGVTHGHHVITRMLELLTLHSGIGVLITALAAYSLPGATAFGRRRVERDAAIAGTGAAVGAAETRHRDRAAERRGAVPAERTAEPAAVGAGAGAGAGRETAVAERPASDAAAADGAATDAPATEPAANRAATDPADGGAAPQTQTIRRRRGGLFSRR